MKNKTTLLYLPIQNISIDTPGQILLHYKQKLLSQNFTQVKVLE